MACYMLLISEPELQPSPKSGPRPYSHFDSCKALGTSKEELDTAETCPSRPQTTFLSGIVKALEDLSSRAILCNFAEGDWLDSLFRRVYCRSKVVQ